MNRAPPSTKQPRETQPDKLDDAVDGTARRDGDVGGERPRVVSARAYDLLLPDSVTSIASIRVAGDPVLARLPRDGVTMVSCRLTGGETPSRGIDPSEQGAETTSDGRSLPFAPASLDCVILHGTLDRWHAARALLCAARAALGEGGIVALTAANLLDPARLRQRLGFNGGDEQAGPIARRRSLWGYHSLLRRCGLSPTASYFVVWDATAAPTRIISTCYAPSTAFFGLQSSTLTGPRRLMMLGLNAVNLLPHVQSRFLILARK